MDEYHAELIQKLGMSLDVCMDLVKDAASKERRRESGKTMRDVTWQQRVESFAALVDEARAALHNADKDVYF